MRSGNNLARRYPIASLWLAASIIVIACDSDWAKKLDTGVIVPNFRIRADLVEPLTRAELAARVGRLAVELGISEPVSDASRFSFTWVSPRRDGNHRSGVRQYQLRLITKNEAPEPLSHFELMFVNGDHSDFQSSDWNTYFLMSCVLIPTEFPEASVTTIRHPVKFSSKDVQGEVASKLYANGLSEQWNYLTNNYPPLAEECSASMALISG